MSLVTSNQGAKIGVAAEIAEGAPREQQQVQLMRHHAMHKKMRFQKRDLTSRNAAVGDTGEMAQDGQGAAAGKRDATSGEAQENAIPHVMVILPAGIQS